MSRQKHFQWTSIISLNGNVITVDTCHWLGYRFVTKCCYCRQDLLLQFCPTSRHQNFLKKWDKTLCANFTAIDMPFPCPLPMVNFASQHIAIAYNNLNILPSHREKMVKRAKAATTQNHEVNPTLSASLRPK
jgi:hypothetical protein